MIKVAVIGGGHWGRNLIRNFTDLGALAMVCDTSFTTCAYYLGIDPKMVDYLNLERPIYTGIVASELENVLAFDEIRGIAIATPNELHYPMAKRSLLAGKDVFIEKPMTTDVRQAEELVELADKNKCILMVGHLMRYHPAITTLEEQDIGRIKYIHTTRCRPKDTRTDDVIWGLGPHDMSLVLHLVGKPQKVTSQRKDNSVLICLEFDWAKGHIFLSYDSSRKSELTVIGDRTGLTVTFSNEPQPKEPLRIELEHFLHCIETREQPLTDGREGLEVVKVLAACE